MRKPTRRMKPLCLLLALSVCCVGVLRPKPGAQASSAQPLLRFSQSFALSDFDGDGRSDVASLSEVGQRKIVEIGLSRTGTRSLLQFDTESVGPGSLVADDVNDDGATDLVWTDLLHPNDVVIWFGDGAGRFERFCPHEYASRFVIPDSSVAAPDGPAADTAAFCNIKHFLDLSFTRRSVPSIDAGVLSSPPNRAQSRRGTNRQPSDRGPPYGRSVYA
ncbi:MAG TPA: VCBS repeat-containing protein [Blastocatellia bacterium]|nr:VCBS repeat-containing protein [Blastocatellia bacterium]